MGPGLFVLRWFAYILALAGFVAALYMYEKVFLTILHGQDDFLDMEKYKENLDSASWSLIGCITLALFGAWCQLMGEHLSASNIFFAVAICLLYATIFAVIGCFIAVWTGQAFEKIAFMVWNIKRHRQEKATSEVEPSIEDIRQHAIIRNMVKHPYISELKDFIKRTVKSTKCIFEKISITTGKFLRKISFNKWSKIIKSIFSRK